MKPPPKPPKPTNIKLKSNFLTSSGTPSPTVLSDSSTSHNISSQSSENLKNSNNSIYDQQTKSTASLNGLQKIKSLASKKLETTSDSVLNKVKLFKAISRFWISILTKKNTKGPSFFFDEI